MREENYNLPACVFFIETTLRSISTFVFIKTAHRPSPKRFFHHAQRGHAANLKKFPAGSFSDGEHSFTCYGLNPLTTG